MSTRPEAIGRAECKDGVAGLTVTEARRRSPPTNAKRAAPGREFGAFCGDELMSRVTERLPQGAIPESTADLDLDFDMALACRDLMADLAASRGRLHRAYDGRALPTLDEEIEAVTAHLADLEGLRKLQGARVVLRRLTAKAGQAA